MNTVPYTNARRAGRTQPGLIEIILPGDPRYRPGGRPQAPMTLPNRAELRAAGMRNSKPIKRSAAARKLHRPKREEES